MIPDHMDVWCKGIPKDNILQTHSYKHDAIVTSVSVDPLETFIITGTRDGQVIMWSLDDSEPNKKLQTLDADGPVISLDYSKNLLAYSQEIATSTKLPRVRVFMYQWADEQSWNEISIDQPHTEEVTCVRISKDGRRIVTGGYDGQVVVYERGDDLDMKFKTLRSVMYYDFDTELKGIVSSVAFSDDGNLVAIGGVLKTVKIFDIEEKKFTTSLEASSYSWITGVVVSKGQGDTFVMGDATKTDIELVEDGHSVSYRDLERTGESTHWSSIDLSPDERFVAAGSWDQHVTVWDRSNNATKAMHRFKHGDRVNAIAFMNSNCCIVSASSDMTAAVWRLDPDNTFDLASGTPTLASDTSTLASDTSSERKNQSSVTHEDALLRNNESIAKPGLSDMMLQQASALQDIESQKKEGEEEKTQEVGKTHVSEQNRYPLTRLVTF